MRKRSLIPLVVLVWLFLLPVKILHADSARVLPRGVSNIEVIYYNYFDIDERYDPDGDAEDIAVDYNTDLNSSVFPALAPFDALPGGASLGRSVVDFSLEYRWWEIAYGYGLSNRVTLGILVPYNRSRNNVNAFVDSTTATVGKIPVPPYLDALPPFGSGTPLTTQDVQDLLGPGLDADNDGNVDIAGFGYDPVESWSESGLGDIELLAKYMFHEQGDWRLAFTGGLRLPTGEVDDPDNLVDVGFGDGNTDIITRFHADYTGIDKLFVNATLRFDIQLPDKETKRVPDDVNLPLTTNRETVDRDLGDILELELLGNYALSREWSVGLKYRYTNKFKDKVDGDNPAFQYGSLENETDLTSHMGFLTVGYSTVQKYLDKEASVPLHIDLAYRNRFAGKNNATVSEFISLNFGLYFQ